MNILFQEDSLTDSGQNRNIINPNMDLGSCYVNLIASRTKADKHEKEINVYNRVIGGDKTNDIYARWRVDTLNVKYDVFSILCGIKVNLGFLIFSKFDY